MTDETKTRMYKVRPVGDSSWLITERLDDIVADLEDGETYTVVPVLMTREEIESLGEFDGW